MSPGNFPERLGRTTAVQLITLCLSARWDVKALEAARTLVAQANVDWDALSQMARRERVAPLLYRATLRSGLLPPNVEEAMRHAYYATMACNLRLLHRLELALLRLDTEGVAVVVLKGAALAQKVYRQPALRPMDDVDLLLRREDVPLARRVLATLGYAEACPDMGDGWTDAYKNAVMLVHPEEAGARLDIHWSLFTYADYYRIPMDWFWQTALPTRFGDAPARVLGPAAQVLHLCAHILQHSDREVKLIAFHDLVEVLAFYGEQVDWDQVLQKAQEYDLVLVLQRVLSRLQEEWHVSLPDSVLARVAALQPSIAEQHAFDQLRPTATPAQGFWRELLSAPGWRLRLGLARSVLLPTAGYMRWRYRIKHRGLLPLYYPYRWLTSLRRKPRGRALLAHEDDPWPTPPACKKERAIKPRSSGD